MVTYSCLLATCNMHAVSILRCNIDSFLLNKKGLESMSILHKNFCNMHIAHRNMHIAIESILPLTYDQVGKHNKRMLGSIFASLLHWSTINSTRTPLIMTKRSTNKVFDEEMGSTAGWSSNTTMTSGLAMHGSVTPIQEMTWEKNWSWPHTILQGSSDYLAGSKQEFRRPHHNHLTSINAKIDRRDDGDVRIARRISDI